MSTDSRDRRIRRVLIGILVLNGAVALAKGIAGAMADSLSMVSDAIHSTFDAGSNIVGLIAITAAARDPDREHPYGHQKFEIVGASIIAAFLAIAAWHIGVSAVERYSTGEIPRPSTLQFGVLLGTLIVNVFVALYEARQGRLLKSELLLADAQHTRSDILTSLAVVASLLCAKYGVRVADPIIALLIACYVAWVAGRLVLSTSRILADRAILDAKEVERVVLSTTGVRHCHDVRTRGPEGSIFADLRIHVDPELSLRSAHEISHAVEDSLRAAFPGLRDVVVHVEPDDEEHL